MFIPQLSVEFENFLGRPYAERKNWEINFRLEQGWVIKNLAGEASLNDEDPIQRTV